MSRLRLTRGGRTARRDAAQSTPVGARLALVAAAVLVAIATLTPTGTSTATAVVRGSWRCLVCGPTGGADVVANVLLFGPLGAALRACGLRWPAATLVGAAASAAIEIVQAIGGGGRDPTLGDVLANTAGTALGVLGAQQARRWLRPSRGTARRLVAGAVAVWIAAAGMATWLLGPDAPPAAIGRPDIAGPQVIRPSDGLDAPPFGWYGGIVLEARVDAWHQRTGRTWTGPVAVLALPSRERSAAARVRGGDPGGRVVPFLYVHDPAGRPHLALAQADADLVVSVRRRADRWRLRAPDVRLPGALAPVFRRGPDGTAHVETWLRADTVALTVAAQGATGTVATSVADTVVVGPSVAWSVLLPYARLHGPERLPLTAASFALFLVPLGYWTCWATTGHRRRRWVAGAVLLGAALGVGLTVVPALGGMTGATAGEWLAALGAVAAGWGAAHRGATRARDGRTRAACSPPPRPGSFGSCPHSSPPSTSSSTCSGA